MQVDLTLENSFGKHMAIQKGNETSSYIDLDIASKTG